MKKINLIKLSLLWRLAFIAALLVLPATLINAQTQCTTGQTVTFAQFAQIDPSVNAFTFTNTGSGGFFTASVPVNLTFAGSAAIFSGPADLTVSGSTSAIASTVPSNDPNNPAATRTIQPFNQQVTIQFTRLGVNLLTAIVNPATSSPDLSGDTSVNQNGAAGFSAATGNQTITYNSDILNFSNTESRNLALSFSSISPNFLRNPNGFLNSFTAAGTGTFASCPGPLPPSAAPAMISGRVLTPTGRGLANTLVSLSNSAGKTIYATTNGFGYYRFADVEVGQSIVISVKSKRYSYAPKVISLNDELAELDFYPE